MTNGDADANTLLSDNAWGALINPDDTVVIEASRGSDIVKKPTKVDRDVAMIKLTKEGALDKSFSGGAGGIAGISIAGNTYSGRALNDNARRPKLDTGGKIVASSYGSAAASGALPAVPNQPAVYRFLPNGALDTSYSGDGDRQPHRRSARRRPSRRPTTSASRRAAGTSSPAMATG